VLHEFFVNYCCGNQTGKNFFREVIISEFLSIVTTPLAGDNPFGTNINYDTEFETVKNEVNKLGGNDFDLIEEISVKLLKEKSKDIRLLSFLSMIYLRKENWEGFCDVFDGMGTLFEQNYDAVFPDRERAKQMALKWLSEERYTELLKSKKPTEAEYDHLVRLVAGLTKMKPVLEQKFPEGSPFPSGIFQTAQLWEKSCKPKPKVEAPPPVQQAPAATAQPAATISAVATGTAPAAGATAAAPSGNEPMDTPKQAQAIVKKGAQFIIEKEPLKPMGYRLMRSLRWDLLEKTPPSDGGKTQLNGPQPQQRTYFTTLLGQSDFKTAFEKAEAAFSGGANHLWLDLQRIICTSCKSLGGEYVQIGNAILMETAYLVKRLPDIVNLQFSDGTPFCDDATKNWISSEVSAAGAGGSSSGGASGGKDDPLKEELAQAQSLAASGKVEDAMDLLQKGIRNSSGGRSNFLRSATIGDLLLKAKQPDLAVAVLETLDEKIEANNLVQWDHEIAVDAWSSLVMAYKAAKVNKQPNVIAMLHEKQNTILKKISLVDPGKACQLNK
jgi:type VI secretion system protein VasJ